MKRLTLIAALAAGPAHATDAAMSRITNALTQVHCKDLVRIVIDEDMQNATEGQIRLAAMGIIVGRALSRDPKGEDIAAGIEREKTRLRLECLDHPDLSWMAGILALQMN